MARDFGYYRMIWQVKQYFSVTSAALWLDLIA